MIQVFILHTHTCPCIYSSFFHPSTPPPPSPSFLASKPQVKKYLSRWVPHLLFGMLLDTKGHQFMHTHTHHLTRWVPHHLFDMPLSIESYPFIHAHMPGCTHALTTSHTCPLTWNGHARCMHSPSHMHTHLLRTGTPTSPHARHTHSSSHMHACFLETDMPAHLTKEGLTKISIGIEAGVKVGMLRIEEAWKGHWPRMNALFIRQ